MSECGYKTCCALTHLLDLSKSDMFSKKGKVPITSPDWLLLTVPPLHFLPSFTLSCCLSLDTEGQICPYKQLPSPWVIGGEGLTLGSEKNNNVGSKPRGDTAPK